MMAGPGSRAVNQEQAFLQDVIEHPDDDAPRLVYADWLDEHGKADRPAVIRLPRQLARHKDPPGLAREVILLRKNAKRWAGPLAKHVDEVAYRRGFVEMVAVEESARFLSRARELFALAPLRALRLRQCSPVLAHLVEAPECL